MNNYTAIALILASLGIFFGYITPTYSKATEGADIKHKSIQELKEEHSRYDDALAKARDIEERINGLLTVYNKISAEDREKLEKLLPDHIDSVRLIIDVNNIASQHGLTLRNITLTDDPARVAQQSIGPSEKKYSKVGLRFAVNGSYESFRSFLEDLERSLRLVDVDTLGFTAREDAATGAPAYDFSVVIATYKLE